MTYSMCCQQATRLRRLPTLTLPATAAGAAVARWVYDVARRYGSASYELIDLKDVDLPLLDEESAPMLGRYTRPHTHRWAERVAPFDGFVFVTPEYNHGMPASLPSESVPLWTVDSHGLAMTTDASGTVMQMHHIRDARR
jgi:NADPH-dependent FMN reductase